MTITRLIRLVILCCLFLSFVPHSPSAFAADFSAVSEPTCTYTFFYADRGETSVEVRGDFPQSKWTSGIPLKKMGKTWFASVQLPAGRKIEYKFLLNGSRWVLDPALGQSQGTNPFQNSSLNRLACSSYQGNLRAKLNGPNLPNQGALVRYPIPPVAFESSNFSLEADQKKVFVETSQNVSYVRFGMKAPVALKLTALSESLVGARIFPKRDGEIQFNWQSNGQSVRFQLTQPKPLVVTLASGKQLFILPDSIDGAFEQDSFEDNPDAINVHSRGIGLKAENNSNTVEFDFETDSTVELQLLINEAAEKRKTLYFPAGIYNTRTLQIPSNAKIFFAAGALLRAIPDPFSFPVDEGRTESGSNELLPPDKRFLGRTMTFSRMLNIFRAENVRLEGYGVIDAQGTFVRNMHNRVPNTLRVTESSNITVTGLFFRDAAAWTLHLLASNNLAMRNLKLVNDRGTLNTDGIDPDMSSDVIVEDSFIYTKDDGICVKATGNSDLSGNSERIVVRNNLVSSVDAALKIGTESDASLFSDIRFENNAVFDSHRAMSVVVRDGALYKSIAFDGVEIGENVEHLIEQVIGKRDPKPVQGNIENLLFANINAPYYQKPQNNWTWYAQFRNGNPLPTADVFVFEGHNEENKLNGLFLKNLFVRGYKISDLFSAESIAGLSVGPFVENVTFE